MKTLILAEKPSVGRDIAAVLGGFGRQEGYLENDQYVVSWSFGHITTLAAPQEYDSGLEKWALNTLPVIPERFRLTITEKKQFNILQKLMRREDITAVTNACDAGREGELIFRWIYQAACSSLPIRRLWLSETTPAAIREAMRTARDGSEYENLYAAAEARAQADWLVGINATRAFTVRHGELLSIGRVQTPTLALIVNREREIRDFRTVPFWQVVGTFRTETGESYQGLGLAGESDRFSREIQAREFTSRVTETGTVASVQQTEKKESPPALFNLNDLQREANRIHGLTAAQVLETAQSLYEKKLLTYPRTDSRYLTMSLAGSLEGRIRAALNHAPFESFPSPAPSLGKRYVDDAKVTDHHAIITTDILTSGNLSSNEQKIYDLVCRRFLAIFLPPARYKVMEAITKAGEQFISKGKTFISRGWRELYSSFKNSSSEDDTGLPDLAEGQAVTLNDVQLVKKETKPPARYTDATILSAMENAGRFIDDKDLADTLKQAGGIGTPATRAATLEKLIKVGYILRQKKFLVPTVKGETLVDLVPDLLKDPATTAEWEDGLAQVERGRANVDIWLEGIKNTTKEVVNMAVNQKKRDTVSKSESIGKCPLCGNYVVEGQKGYGCSGWKEGCEFVIWKEIAKKKITVKQAKELLKKRRTELIKGFKAKTGKDFDATLVLNSEGKVEFAYPERNSEALGKCPLCGKDVVEGQKGYGCSGWKEGCEFTIWKEIAGKKITVKQAKGLLEKGKTCSIKGFKSKAGKDFEAALALNDKKKVEFVFDFCKIPD